MSHSSNDYHFGRYINRSYPDPLTEVDPPKFNPNNPAISPESVARYYNDTVFRYLVDEMGVLLRTRTYSPKWLQNAVNLAIDKHRQYDDRPIPKCSTSAMPGDKQPQSPVGLSLFEQSVIRTLKGAAEVMITDITPRTETFEKGWFGDMPCGPRQILIRATWPAEPIAKKSAPTVIPETPKPAEPTAEKPRKAMTPAEIRAELSSLIAAITLPDGLLGGKGGTPEGRLDHAKRHIGEIIGRIDKATAEPKPEHCRKPEPYIPHPFGIKYHSGNQTMCKCGLFIIYDGAKWLH